MLRVFINIHINIFAMSEQELAPVEQPTEIVAVPVEKPQGFDRRGSREEESKVANWVPKTSLGQDVVKGKYASLNEILTKGLLILEPEIVDYLVPNLKEEMMYIGGTPGKGGGIKRTATRMTARMHKSGRRYSLTAVAIVGNEDGIVGAGRGNSIEHRGAIQKATQHAKLGVMQIKRGCGSWECNCQTNHSIPYQAEGKSGSVTVVLKPAPKGIGIVAHGETKKILKMAGIKDIWVKSFGQTSSRINLTFAVLNALKNLTTRKGDA